MIAMAIAFVVTLAIGVPIVFALGIAGAVGLYALDLDLITVPTRLFTGMDNFVLLAAPFYILAGEIMNRGGITERLIRLANGLAFRLKRAGIRPGTRAFDALFRPTLRVGGRLARLPGKLRRLLRPAPAGPAAPAPGAARARAEALKAARKQQK